MVLESSLNNLMIKVLIFVSKEWNEICYLNFDVCCDEKV